MCTQNKNELIFILMRENYLAKKKHFYYKLEVF